MLKAPRFFRKRLKDTMVESGITGEIPLHGDEFNRKAIEQALLLDPYFTFGIKTLNEKNLSKLSLPDVQKIMADSLGISVKRYTKPGASFIDPDLTYRRLNEMLDLIDGAIESEKIILLATGHPGSLLQFYLDLQSYIERRGGKIFRLNKAVKTYERHWLDSVGSVIVRSDRGSLLHTHECDLMQNLLKKNKGIGLMVSDHGFAGAGINAKIPTVGIHDVDDTGIPLAIHFGENVLAVPMNDNQFNLQTVYALRALMGERHAAPSA